MAVMDRIKSAWNAFTEAEKQNPYSDLEYSTPTYGTAPPSRTRLRYFNERTIVTAIYNRIAIDVAEVALKHVKVDELGRYAEDVNSHLNTCLTLEPNLDQGPRQFRQDICQSLFDKGIAAIVPIDTAVDPTTRERFDIYTMRVGEVTKWHPKHVTVSIYNEEKGIRQEVRLEKSTVAIIENPLYSVMNEQNGTLQRLTRKLGLLDAVDEATSSGKLDLIIQLPYVIKSEARRQQAEQRKQDIEFQLKGSQYGIAYTDGTEKITQLNRPAENNLLKQIEYLTTLLYGQLGITEEVMNGTASEAAMLNYYNRTIEPIVDAIVEAMQRTFLGVTGTKKGQRIAYYRDPFKLVPVAQLAEIADKFTRNEILTSNEIRGFMGIQPANDPKADKLQNSNMPHPEVSGTPAVAPADPEAVKTAVNAQFDKLEAEVAQVERELASG